LTDASSQQPKPDIPGSHDHRQVTSPPALPPLSASHVSRSHEIHAFYLDLHCKSREYKKRIRAKNEKEIKEGKVPTEGFAVEMNNFQNPQVWVSPFHFAPS